MRPTVWTPRQKRTVWLDFKTGRGITDNGSTVRPKIGERRKNPNLTDLLDTAQALGAERIMLTGKVPEVAPGKAHWLIVRTPGWTPGGHWLNKPVTGRFTHDVSGQELEVRTAEEWFGLDELTPTQARDAWSLTGTALAEAVPGAVMFLTPAGTGANAWALSLPKSIDPPTLPGDIAEELHLTSGQHRIEHLTTGPDRCDCGACLPLVDAEATPTLETFSYVDGRFMYAGVCRELGTGPARRLTGSHAADLLELDPYARARFKVRVTVPGDWHHVGLFGVKHEEISAGWHYPNQPGTTWETWADGAEIKIARDAGWIVHPLEAVEFTKARVLDTFADRMVRARERVNAAPDAEPEVRRAAAAALRSMLIQTIGNFASRIKGRTVTVWSARDVPADYVHTIKRFGDAWTYEQPGRPHTERTLPYYRPELAAQVWGRARARVLRGPTGLAGVSGGVLSMDPSTVLGINGDAIYSTVVPSWALPTAQGGGDDGKVGRLRLKGVLRNVPTPRRADERNVLRAKAEAVGVPGWEADV
ncbi:hypothetical protein H9623_17955 [Oerskovia sp. Sa1BUA8]|uniref:Uncharacterized protein n=1 Tax=Oerskovia douganii TaxID=2762210 RepID=A0A9D5UCI8_9CELL|nr:hypothetical protein [Oerskovia douganii]MBE7702178.1 hypothetical protein [Oerskovia douganii]